MSAGDGRPGALLGPELGRGPREGPLAFRDHGTPLAAGDWAAFGGKLLPL